MGGNSLFNEKIKSLVISMRLPAKGNAIGTHLKLRGYEVAYASASKIIDALQENKPDFLIV